MYAFFWDIRIANDTPPITHRLPGATFDEILFADDTICVSGSAEGMSDFIRRIETHSSRYGMALNRTKCEVFTLRILAPITFSDGAPVALKTEATYLGCKMNKHNNIDREANARLSQCYLTWKRFVFLKRATAWRSSTSSSGMRSSEPSCYTASKQHKLTKAPSTD